MPLCVASLNVKLLFTHSCFNYQPDFHIVEAFIELASAQNRGRKQQGKWYMTKLEVRRKWERSSASFDGQFFLFVRCFSVVVYPYKNIIFRINYTIQVI